MVHTIYIKAIVITDVLSIMQDTQSRELCAIVIEQHMIRQHTQTHV